MAEARGRRGKEGWVPVVKDEGVGATCGIKRPFVADLLSPARPLAARNHLRHDRTRIFSRR